MTEDNKQTTTEQTTTGEPTITASDVRNHELFQKLTSQLKEITDAEKAREDAAKVAAKEKKRDELKAKNDWATLEADYIKQIEALNEEHKNALENRDTTHSKELTRRDLKQALTVAGITEDFTLAGAMDSYDPEMEIADYITTLKESKPHIFASGNNSGAQALVTPSPSVRTTSKTLEERAAEGDTSAILEGFGKVFRGEIV